MYVLLKVKKKYSPLKFRWHSDFAFFTHHSSWWSTGLMSRVSSNGESIIRSQKESKQRLTWCLCFNSPQTSDLIEHTHTQTHTHQMASGSTYPPSSNKSVKTNTGCHMLSDKRKIKTVCLGEESWQRSNTFHHIPGKICFYRLVSAQHAVCVCMCVMGYVTVIDTQNCYTYR